ncbi:MAG: histidine kinase dimerization/phospho-acceptor domain-containing protein, partial [Longimicrobiales bacterium]
MDHKDWNSILGHELRSPIAAILGYQELLEEGTLGDLPPAANDAVQRIRFAANQLLLLVAAIERTDSDEVETVDARDVIHDVLATIRFEAEARGTRIDTTEDAVALVTRRTDACRALALALSAAIKVTPGGTLQVAAADGD